MTHALSALMGASAMAASTTEYPQLMLAALLFGVGGIVTHLVEKHLDKYK